LAFLIDVVLLNDRGLWIDRYAMRGDAKLFDLFQQLFDIDGETWSQHKERRGEARARRKLMVNGLASRVRDRVAGIWATDSDEDVILIGQVGNDVALPFAPILSSHNHIHTLDVRRRKEM